MRNDFKVVNDFPEVSTQIYTLFSGCEIAPFFGRYYELYDMKKSTDKV